MRMLKPFLFLLVCLAGSWLGASPAAAQSCTFSTSGAMAFGPIQTSDGTAFDTTMTLTANCSGTLIATAYVCANFGDGTGGAVGSIRTMRSGANSLQFNLYKDAARTNMWGSTGWQGTPLKLTIPMSGLIFTSGSETFTVYGRVLAGQNGAPAGSYLSAMSGVHTDFRVGTSTAACNANYGTRAASQPSFNITATVESGCTVNTTDVNFGARGVLDANTDAQGSVRVTCSSGKSWSAALAVQSGESVSARRMYRGSEFVTYALYRDAARTLLFGEASGQVVAGTGTGAQQTIQVYGRVPPQSTPTAGEYTDTVVVTITY